MPKGKRTWSDKRVCNVAEKGSGEITALLIVELREGGQAGVRAYLAMFASARGGVNGFSSGGEIRKLAGEHLAEDALAFGVEAGAVDGGFAYGEALPLLAVLGEENTVGALEGRTPAGPLTFGRVSTDDLHGKIRASVGEGSATDDPLNTFWTKAVAHVPPLEKIQVTSSPIGGREAKVKRLYIA